MHIHLPVAPSFFLRSPGPNGAIHETMSGLPELATRLREIARAHGASPWMFSIREALALLAEQNAIAVHDADGAPLSPVAIVAANRPPATLRNGRVRRFKYRDGPVPWTGGRRGGSCYRSPATHRLMIAEAIAAGEARDPEHDLPSRFIHALAHADKHPTVWDDILRCRDKSWKRQRKTRWR